MIVHNKHEIEKQGYTPTGATYRGELPPVAWRQRHAKRLNVAQDNLVMFRTSPGIWTAYVSQNKTLNLPK